MPQELGHFIAEKLNLDFVLGFKKNSSSLFHPCLSVRFPAEGNKLPFRNIFKINQMNLKSKLIDLLSSRPKAHVYHNVVFNIFFLLLLFILFCPVSFHDWAICCFRLSSLLHPAVLQDLLHRHASAPAGSLFLCRQVIKRSVETLNRGQEAELVSVSLQGEFLLCNCLIEWPYKESRKVARSQ